jgi:hypothetical protein
MAKLCLTHKDRPAATMCHRCHRPICTSCTLVSPDGSFCSSECNVLYRQFKAANPRGAPSGHWAGKLAGIVLCVVLLLAGIHLAARAGIGAAKPFDLVGRLLGQVEALKR